MTPVQGPGPGFTVYPKFSYIFSLVTTGFTVYRNSLPTNSAQRPAEGLNLDRSGGEKNLWDSLVMAYTRGEKYVLS